MTKPPSSAHRRIGVVALAVAALGLAACTGPTDVDTLGATQGLPDTHQALTAHTWVLDGAAGTPEVAGDRTTTLTFSGRTLGGQAPCNTYHARVTVDGDDIEIGRIATTGMACGGAANLAERTYLAALGSVDAVDVTDPTRLVLTGDDVRLEFDRIDLAAAIVGEWDVTAVNTGHAIVSPVEGTSPTLTFSDDGTVSADAGCDVTTGSWRLDGPLVTVTALRPGTEHCPGPAGAKDQDAALHEALGAAARVEVTDRLTLFDDQDRIAVVATRAGP